MSSDVILHLAENAYAAALDESLWEPWLVSLSQEIGAAAGILTALNTTDGSLRPPVFSGRGAEMMEEYLGQWAPYDPQARQVAALKGPVVYTDRDLPDDNLDTTKAYRNWERTKYRIQHHVSVVAELDRSGMKGVFSLHPDVADGPPPASQVAKVATLMPDVVRAMCLGFRHNTKLSERYWEGLRDRHAEEAVLLLDERGRLLRASEAALALLADNDGIGLQRCELKCLATADHAWLAELITKAVAVYQPRAGAMRISRCSGRQSYVFAIYPLIRKRRALAPFEAAALVTLTDLTGPDRVDAALLRQAFGLTARETEIASLLRGGHSVESAAATCEIAVSTARLHLHHVFEKTNTNRQSELVGLLAGLR